MDAIVDKGMAAAIVAISLFSCRVLVERGLDQEMSAASAGITLFGLPHGLSERTADKKMAAASAAIS